MSTTILHCGIDDCSRTTVLAHRGFRIQECGLSAEQLEHRLDGTNGIHAIVFSESGTDDVDRLASIARAHPAIPVILFANPDSNCNPDLYDLVIPAGTPPNEWLEGIQRLLALTSELMEHSRKVHEQTTVLRADSAAVRQQSRDARQRCNDLRKQLQQGLSRKAPRKDGH